MNRIETVDLLTLMSVFDRRNVDEADILAWENLPVVQNNSFEVGKAAVVWFFDRDPDDRGNVAYLTPQWFRFAVKQVKERMERNEARRRAVMDTDERRALEQRERYELDMAEEAKERAHYELQP